MPLEYVGKPAGYAHPKFPHDSPTPITRFLWWLARDATEWKASNPPTLFSWLWLLVLCVFLSFSPIAYKDLVSEWNDDDSHVVRVVERIESSTGRGTWVLFKNELLGLSCSRLISNPFEVRSMEIGTEWKVSGFEYNPCTANGSDPTQTMFSIDHPWDLLRAVVVLAWIAISFVSTLTSRPFMYPIRILLWRWKRHSVQYYKKVKEYEEYLGSFVKEKQ